MANGLTGEYTLGAYPDKWENNLFNHHQLRIKDIQGLNNVDTLESITFLFSPKSSEESDLIIDLPKIIYNNGQSPFIQANGQLMSRSDNYLTGFVASPLKSMPYSDGLKMRNQYDIVTNPNFDNSAEYWTINGSIEEISESGIRILYNSSLSQRIDFTSGYNGDFLINFWARNNAPTSDTTSKLQLRFNDDLCNCVSNYEYFQISSGNEWKYYQYKLIPTNSVNNNLLYLEYYLFGPGSSNKFTEVRDFHITASGHKDSDPEWYKYQDFDPVKLTTDNNYLQQIMAQYGWYEPITTGSDNANVNPFNDVEFIASSSQFDPFTQYFFTNVWIDYNGVLNSNGTFNTEITFTNMLGIDLDFTFWINGNKRPSMNNDVSVQGSSITLNNYEFRPGMNTLLLELIVPYTSTATTNGVFKLSFTDTTNLDFRTLSPYTPTIRAPFYFYDPTIATADIDAAPFSDDFITAIYKNDIWSITNGITTNYIDDISDDYLEIIKDGDANNVYSMTQNLPRIGEFTVDTTLNISIPDLDTEDRGGFQVAGLIFGLENDLYRLIFNYNSVTNSSRFDLLDGGIILDTFTVNGSGLGTEYDIRLLINNLPKSGSIGQKGSIIIIIQESGTSSLSGSMYVEFDTFNSLTGVSNVEADNKFIIGYYFPSNDSTINLQSRHFNVQGLGDLDLLAREASFSILSGESALLGGTSYLQRYIHYDLSSMPKMNGSGIRPTKSLWRPTGTVISLNDAMPVEVMKSESTGYWDSFGIYDNGTIMESWLEGGGKLLFVSGAIPFMYVANGHQLEYESHLGHQKIYDISQLNSDLPYDIGLYTDSQNDINPTNNDLNNPEEYLWSSNDPLLMNGFGQTYNQANGTLRDDGNYYVSGLGYNPNILAHYQFALQDIQDIDSDGDFELVDKSRNNIHLDIDFNSDDNVNYEYSPIEYLDNYYISSTYADTFSSADLSVSEFSKLQNGFTVEFTLHPSIYLGSTSIVVGDLEIEVRRLYTSDQINVTVKDNDQTDPITFSSWYKRASDYNGTTNTDVDVDIPVRIAVRFRDIGNDTGQGEIFFRRNVLDTIDNNYNSWWSAGRNSFNTGKTVADLISWPDNRKISIMEEYNVISDLIIYESPKNYGTDYNVTNLNIDTNDLDFYYGDVDDNLLVKSPMLGDSSNSPVVQYDKVYDIPGIAGLTRVFDRHTIIGKQEFDILEVRGIAHDDKVPRVQFSILDRNGNRADSVGFPDRYTTPQEQNLYHIPLTYDSTSRLDFIDERPYLSYILTNINGIALDEDYELLASGKPTWWDSTKNYIDAIQFSDIFTIDDDECDQTIEDCFSNWNELTSDTKNYIAISQKYFPEQSITTKAQESFQEFHAERIELSSAAIQAGKGSKGMIATLPLMNWNRMKASGINPDSYINRPEDAGLTNSLVDESTARKEAVIAFIQAAKEASFRMMLTGVVTDNSETRANFLETFTGTLPQGDQYSSNDNKARFMVRITQNNTDSIEKTRILEGVDDEIDYFGNDRSYYPLYLWSSVGEHARMFYDNDFDDMSTEINDYYHNTVILWKRLFRHYNNTDQFVPAGYDPLNPTKFYTRNMYHSDKNFGNDLHWDNQALYTASFFNTQQPDCNSTFYPRLDDGSMYSAGLYCQDGSRYSSTYSGDPIYREAPGYITVDLDFLIGGLDLGANNIVIPISESDERNETLTIAYSRQGELEVPWTRDYKINYMEQFDNDTPDNALGNGGFPDVIRGSTIRADGYTSVDPYPALPIQLLTLENITMDLDDGDHFAMNISNGRMDWNFETDSNDSSLYRDGEIHLSIGSLRDDNFDGYTINSTYNIWRQYSSAPETVGSYARYMTGGWTEGEGNSFLQNGNPLILRNGLVQSGWNFFYNDIEDGFNTPYGIDSNNDGYDDYLGSKWSNQAIPGSARYTLEDPLTEDIWNIYNVEAITRTPSNHTEYEGRVCNDYDNNGDWYLCKPSTDYIISSDYFHDSGYEGTLGNSHNSTFDQDSSWTNNGGSQGAMLTNVGFFSTGTLINDGTYDPDDPLTNDNYKNTQRSKYYSLTTQKQLIFSTGFFSRPERLANYYGNMTIGLPDLHTPSLLDQVVAYIQVLAPLVLMIASFIAVVTAAGLVTAGWGAILTIGLISGVFGLVFDWYTTEILAGEKYDFVNQGIPSFASNAFIGGAIAWVGWAYKLLRTGQVANASLKTLSKIDDIGIITRFSNRIRSIGIPTSKLTQSTYGISPSVNIRIFSGIKEAASFSAIKFIDIAGNVFFRSLLANSLMNIASDPLQDMGLSFFGAGLAGFGNKKWTSFFMVLALAELGFEHLLAPNMQFEACKGEQGMTLDHQFICSNSNGGINVEYFDFLRYAAYSARIDGNETLANILGFTGLIADLDYLATRHIIQTSGLFYDALFDPGKFSNGTGEYWKNQTGYNIELFNLHLFQSEMREFWMYHPDYKSENDIRSSYNSVESMLVEYGLMDIY
ncbi:MAG: hypothetical protein HeimC3_20480 [Candidatus Heimdallarchaeota archaeon LC_3]|nr:MAG: hypothetical protein HeimC3_20480 [Candidatus Heimdallarchaeota archaeon LC_3]